MGYYDVMRQRVVLGEDRISLRLKAGMVPWEEEETAAILLAESAEVPPGGRALLLESGTGALAVWAAWQGAEVCCYDSSLIACRITRETLVANDVRATVVDAAGPSPAEAGRFDVALLPIPKGRAFTGLLLGAAYRALKPGGRLYFAGPNAGGAKAIVKDAGAIFGRATTLRTRARYRVAVAVKIGGAAGAAVPPSLEACRQIEAAGLTLCTMPGVFSWDRLDAGTTRLLDTLDEDVCAGQRVLDVGCGNGVIGLHAARLGAAAVDMVDSSWLAVSCAQESILANGAGATCRAWASDLYADVGDTAYDLILSNPPFHIGHAVETEGVEALIAGARDRLRAGGRLRLVANAFLPYDRPLGDAFGQSNFRVVREDTRFRVFEAVRR
jgi:16S rRNA (guanine1207-N2)-methyltransferase